MSSALEQRLIKLWKSCSAWPDFQQVMRLAIMGGKPNLKGGDQQFSYWESLPGLCCQAAGGDPEWTGDVTLAWLLYYSAAHLMDSVQDGDEPETWWAESGIGVALCAASGLYFSASQSLNAIYEKPNSIAVATEISRRFNKTFLEMCSGQYAEMTRRAPSLEEYWLYAGAKSGAFFSLACWAGARLATDQTVVLDEYALFGHHLGLLIQIKDDLEDIRLSREAGRKISYERSLPVIYALQFVPTEQATLLSESFQPSNSDPDVAQKAIKILDESGAAAYVEIEIEKQKAMALAALDRAGAFIPAAESLAKFVKDPH